MVVGEGEVCVRKKELDSHHNNAEKKKAAAPHTTTTTAITTGRIASKHTIIVPPGIQASRGPHKQRTCYLVVVAKASTRVASCNSKTRSPRHYFLTLVHPNKGDMKGAVDLDREPYWSDTSGICKAD